MKNLTNKIRAKTINLIDSKIGTNHLASRIYYDVKWDVEDVICEKVKRPMWVKIGEELQLIGHWPITK